MNAEFTIHQNTILNSVVYGFLCDTASSTYLANKKPLVDKMTARKTNAGIVTDELILEATVSDPDVDSRIYKVEFFDSWHKIGEAFEAPYKINWTCSGTRDFAITAKVYDELGASNKSVILKRASLITAVIDHENGAPQLNVFPNPSNGEFNFHFQNVDNQFIQLTIFNTEGKLMMKFEPQLSANGSSLFTWNPEKQHSPQGLYMYNSIITSGKQVTKEDGKLVYQKN